MPPANAEVKGKIIIDSTIRKRFILIIPPNCLLFSELKLLHSVTNYRNYFTHTIFILENRIYI